MGVIGSYQELNIIIGLAMKIVNRRFSIFCHSYSKHLEKSGFCLRCGAQGFNGSTIVST